ncbi:MCE family protein [Pseudenhygromyxa sp. WMMC2535]|uniref:MlaD family protein n=1 Tax=Pseudenhygromyxa sp. WMMC2535 TaxID=2712867 RepID=UPI00155370DC|nr:MlaD family protein [Pseudenhygromyxa sp. WMMC2535]NVB39385.1 MCE family protein [Pseudenhygromyxa sp. WMMC2535]
MNRKYIFLGAFVVVTLGLLLWLAQNIGALGGSQGTRYLLDLDHAAGLVEDNAVKIAGVKVGRLERVEVYQGHARLTLLVEPEVEVHDDAVALVRAKSLLGEKYLQLDPGSPEAPRLTDGAAITHVRSTFEVDQVLNALEPILGSEGSIGAAIEPLLKRLDGLMGAAAGEDGGEPVLTREELGQTIDDARATVTAVRELAEDNKEDIGRLIDNANALMEDPRVDRIIGNLDRITTTTANRLPGLLDKADQTLTRADNALASVEKATDELTPERMDAVGQILDDVAVASSNLKDLSEALGGAGEDLGPMVSNLSLLAKRAAGLDELTIRKFLQEEGVLVRVGGGDRKSATQRIDELEE